MRDIGAILWVVIVIVGVISSIISNARRQAARTTPSPRQQPGTRQPGQALRTAPPARPTAAAVQPAPAVRTVSAPSPTAFPEGAQVHERPPSRPHRLAMLFGDRRSLVRAVVAAEVLGRPVALRDGE